jgi:hypothetical protein
MSEHEDRPTRGYALTFGVRYKREPHPSGLEVDPRGYVFIDVDDYDQARALANETYGPAWAFLYPMETLAEKWFTSFPAGQVGRLRPGSGLDDDDDVTAETH